MRRFIVIPLLGIALVFVIAGCAKPAPAPSSPQATAPAPAAKPAGDSAAEFYKKNTVEMIVPYAAGGGSDTTARHIAIYWSKVTGGTMIVKNVTGAGSILGHNQVYSAKPDGLTLGTGNVGTMISTVLFEDPAVKFDPKKVTWISGAFYSPWVFSVSAPKQYNSIQELQQAKGLKFGGMGRANVGVIAQAFLIDALKIDAKIAVGYAGTNEVALAAGRGEIDGTGSGAITQLQGIDKGFLKKPLVVIDYSRTEFWPDMPTIVELSKLTPQQEQLFAIIYGIISNTQPHYTAPGVPEDRVKFLREKFKEIFADQEFRKSGEKFWTVWTEPKTAEGMKTMVDKALTASKSDVDGIWALVDKYILSK